MDPFELLKKDHQKVSDLFEQIESDDDPAVQENLFARIKQELTVHAEIEESILYPRLSEIGELRDMTAEAVGEHQEVKTLLSELDEMSPGDEEWSSTIQELKLAVEHHVEEEENQMFPQAQESLSSEEIFELGEELQSAKQAKTKGAAQ